MGQLRPLGHRVLVTPDPQPERSDSGLILPDDRDHVPVSGTVVAVGPGGSLMRYNARQRAIKDCVEVVESALQMWGMNAALKLVRDEIAGLLGTAAPEREIAVGDRVAYAAESGLSLTEDGTDYILLNEDDVAVLVNEDEVAA